MSHFQPSSSSVVSSSSVDKTHAKTTTSSALSVTSASAARLSVKRKAQIDALPNQQAAAARAEADTALSETKRTRQQRSMNKTEEKVEEKVGEAAAAVASEETEVKQSSARVVTAAAAEEEEAGAVVDAVGEDDVIVDGLVSATALFPTTFDPQLGHHRIYTPSTALLFSSKAAAPWYQLSNFYHVSSGVCVDDVMYPSSEHAFQAQKVNAVQRNRFSIHGDLGQATTGFKLVYGEKKDWMKKKEFWMKKGSIGIIARMAIHPSRIFKLGLTPLNPLIKVEKEQLEQVWLKILRAKYTSQDALQQLLLSTGDQYLAEFSARAKPHDLYACKVNKQTQQLIGYNAMGLLLMRIRKELLTP